MRTLVHVCFLGDTETQCGRMADELSFDEMTDGGSEGDELATVTCGKCRAALAELIVLSLLEKDAVTITTLRERAEAIGESITRAQIASALRRLAAKGDVFGSNGTYHAARA